MRIAAVGDLHCRADTRRNVAVALRGVDQESDVLLLAGDLTDHGTLEEASCEMGLLQALEGSLTERQAAELLRIRDSGRPGGLKLMSVLGKGASSTTPP